MSNIMNEPRGVEIAGKIMVVAVILLFMVAAFILLLHLYTKCFLWRVDEEAIHLQPRVHRRVHRRRRFVFAPGQDPIIYGSNHNHQQGLEPSVLRSLPILVFQQNESFKDDLECAVCLCEVVQGEKARVLPNCKHGFHVDCIDMWFQSHSTCPLCRTLVTSTSTSSCSEQSDSVNSESLSSSQEENFEDLSILEFSNFPTHVLVWGDNTQFSSVGVSLDEENSSSSSSSSSTSNSSSANNDGSNVDNTSNGVHEMVAIDIPSEFTSSSSSSRNGEDEMMKLPPMAARLRSLTRLLSREKKSTSPCNPNSGDLELASTKEFDDGGVH